jgi:sec-independent protein translocase protein TatA
VGKIILVFLVILVLFGTKKLPGIAQGISKGMKDFKDALKNVEDEIQGSDKENDEEKK